MRKFCAVQNECLSISADAPRPDITGDVVGIERRSGETADAVAKAYAATRARAVAESRIIEVGTETRLGGGERSGDRAAWFQRTICA